MDKAEIISEINKLIEDLSDIANTCSYITGGLITHKLDKIKELIAELEGRI